MPLDAVFLSGLIKELAEKLPGAKIDKIYQPAKAEIILQVRSRNGSGKLLISAGANTPRIHFTQEQPENPAVPPMFCMLMRKYFQGARFTAVTQPVLERVVDLEVACVNDLGDEISRHMIIEIMGRNSNLVLTDEDGRIIDCVRRVDYEMSQQRQVLPGLYYHLPPQQGKRNPFEVSLEELSAIMKLVDSPVRPDNFLMDQFAGLPPLICRELVFRFAPGLEDVNSMTISQRYTFAAYLKQAFSEISEAPLKPYLLKKSGTPWDYTYMPVLQYGDLVESIEFSDFSTLLDRFYAKRDAAARLKAKSQTITKTVTNLRNRTARKLQNQRKELADTEDRDSLRLYGELITANLYRMDRGQTKLLCQNYYDPELRQIEIRLDPTLSPQQNAAKYFKDYTKAKNAVIYLTEQIARGEEELKYLESILDELARAETEKDIAEIRVELVNGGYIRSQEKRKRMKLQPSKPLEFVSKSGLRIRVGRNNNQNDQLTLKNSFKSDIWLHTQKIHGSHVIISCEGISPDEETIIEAAKLAAWYSQGRGGQNIPVDYTIVKNVKKPNGAKPGMVIYDHYNTVYVTPDETLVNELKSK